MSQIEQQGRMRLLLLTDGLAPYVTGGMQQHSTLLAKHMGPLLKHLTVMHCGTVNGEVPCSKAVLAELENPSNVKVIGVPFIDTGILPGHYLRASKRLSRFYLKEAGDLSAYDAIYAQGLTGDAFLGKHPKIMVNLHGLEMFQAGYSWREKLVKAWFRPLFRKQIRNAWRSVSLGGKLTDLLVENGVHKDRIVVIPNGIEAKWIISQETRQKKVERSKRRQLRFVMVGRNEYRKGLHILRAAMAELTEPIELHMIGDWPRWDCGIHRIIYHGVIQSKGDLMAILDECDVLLLPSLSEGMPTVILEAAARGVSVIATDVGAVSEMITEITCPANDEIALRQAIRTVKMSTVYDSGRLMKYDWSRIAQLTLVTADNMKQ